MAAKRKTVSKTSQEPFRQALLSAERSLRIDSWQVTSHELDPGSAIPWSVRKTTLHGGKQEGVDLVEIDNGRLRILVVPTRGMGILRAEIEDVRLGWDSPVKEAVHPQFVNLESRDGLGWLEGFNEFLVRCGLEFAGGPGRDRFVNNEGDEAEMQLTLHGKIANIPASEVEVVIDRRPRRRIRVRGCVDERILFGPKLELWSEVSTEPGSSAFRVEDTVANRGAGEQEFQLVYHANYGPPLLEEGSRLLVPVRRIAPMTGGAAKAMDRAFEYGGPVPGAIEQVYCMELFGDRRGRTKVLLRNAAADRGAAMSFDLAELPYFTLWKNLAALEDGYVTGLEPGTCYPANRRSERHFGRVPRLGPGKARRFAIDFEVLLGKDPVARAGAEIGRLQAGRKPQVDLEPPVLKG